MYDPTNNPDRHPVSTGATQASASYVEENYFSLRDLLRIFWQRLWIITLVVLLFVGTAVGLSLSQTPEYEASAQLLLGQKPADAEAPQVNLMGSVEGLQQLTHTVAAAVDSRPVAEEVIQQRGLQTEPEAFLENLTVTQIEDTQFLEVSYTDTDPERARGIANSVAEASSQQIAEANATGSDVTITVWENAVTPTVPVSPDPVRNGLLALGLGLLLGVGLAFLLEYLDDSWRSPEEVERVSNIPTFGVIPEFETVRKGGRKARRVLEDA